MNPSSAPAHMHIVAIARMVSGERGMPLRQCRKCNEKPNNEAIVWRAEFFNSIESTLTRQIIEWQVCKWLIWWCDGPWLLDLCDLHLYSCIRTHFSFRVQYFVFTFSADISKLLYSVCVSCYCTHFLFWIWYSYTLQSSCTRRQRNDTKKYCFVLLQCLYWHIKCVCRVYWNVLTLLVGFGQSKKADHDYFCSSSSSFSTIVISGDEGEVETWIRMRTKKIKYDRKNGKKNASKEYKYNPFGNMLMF